MRGLVLGAGVTGLAAGLASGYEILETEAGPGGMCSSYYVLPGSAERLPRSPAAGKAYRFEIGGGHWIFGGDPLVRDFIGSVTPLREHTRRSAVRFAATGLTVPYPLQSHLHFLDRAVAARAVAEKNRPATTIRTMKEWLLDRFGPTLCDLFFFDFHDRYTASLFDRIAPQDAYKSPASAEPPSSASASGYNARFVYPEAGLNALAERLASRCRVRYASRAVGVDLDRRAVRLADGRTETYDALISTLPLNRMVEMAGVPVSAPPDPFSSVLVLNLGAVRGPGCPDDHWLYVPDSRAGFFRVGFYSNVDSSFVPEGPRKRVGLYIERAYPGGAKPSDRDITAYAAAVIDELTSWGFITEVEVLDPTWIDVAYTWSWPDSTWRDQAISVLTSRGVSLVGRFARWSFQGIAESIRDGLVVGATVRAMAD